jgi:hypothetical protein
MLDPCDREDEPEAPESMRAIAWLEASGTELCAVFHVVSTGMPCRGILPPLGVSWPEVKMYSPVSPE